ncbi:protein FRG1 isoform X2 [Cylas formicarius]|uniref:protein FRG1 isoform X2 n=1 Tax=Cylas formicarius TaxID=197179 RepID=UPI002958621B|nr:protein FRG1 isoform X2 [Cylas formicarius]
MSEYERIRVGKLKLKGDKEKSKKRKHKSRKHQEEIPKIDQDTLKHGSWWKISKVDDISGPVAIEFNNHMYVKALDNGLFTLGAPHDEGEGPSSEEIFTGVPINERKVAFKSGYGKYLGVSKKGLVIGRSDAIGPMEQWEPVFENGKMALSSDNNCFMSVDQEESIVANSKRAGSDQFLIIRSHTVKEINPLKDVPEEEQGNLKQIEINYVKKFQKFQDKRLRLCTEDTNKLKKAKEEGLFHEALLDRRSKMKADRYCK